MTYDPSKQGDRRTMGDFEKEMLVLMGQVKQYMENQPGRCASHSVAIKCVQDGMTNIERAIGYNGPDDEKPIVKRMETIEASQVSYTWLYAWITTAWAAILAIGTWIFGHASQVNAETATHAVTVVKKIKGGG